MSAKRKAAAIVCILVLAGWTIWTADALWREAWGEAAAAWLSLTMSAAMALLTFGFRERDS